MKPDQMHEPRLSSPATSAVLRRFSSASQVHAHDYFQVVWGFEGLVEVELEGRGARIAPGHALVIAPGQRHEFSAPRGARCFVVNCGEGLNLERLAPLAGNVRLGDPSVNHLLRYLALRPVLSPTAAELLLASLTDSSELVARSARRPVDWAALRAWIDANLPEELDVAALAARVHLSPTHFAARCVDELGVTPMALVRQHRLGAALSMRSAGMPVSTIAARCGYRSPSALTAALRREAIER